MWWRMGTSQKQMLQTLFSWKRYFMVGCQLQLQQWKGKIRTVEMYQWNHLWISILGSTCFNSKWRDKWFYKKWFCYRGHVNWRICNWTGPKPRFVDLDWWNTMELHGLGTRRTKQFCSRWVLSWNESSNRRMEWFSMHWKFW